jgi:hypothetical protein
MIFINIKWYVNGLCHETFRVLFLIIKRFLLVPLDMPRKNVEFFKHLWSYLDSRLPVHEYTGESTKNWFAKTLLIPNTLESEDSLN